MVDDDKNLVNGKVNGKDEMPLTSIDLVIFRLKEATRSKNDEQLADFLGIKRQNISSARKNQKIPELWISKISNLTGFSMDWLVTGRGEKNKINLRSQIGQKESEYDQHGGWKPRLGGPEYNVLGKAYEIIKSESIYRSALINNINAFHKALIDDRDKKEIEQRVETLEKQLKQLLENEHRRNKWQHKDPEPPAGESEIDRRSEQS